MSRPTPRKRHRQNPSVGGSGGHRAIPASDYESDAAQYMAARDVLPSAQIPQRTNTELNLSVLRRWQPDIRSIVSIAASAVVYKFTPATETWEKSGEEGTLFVCEQEPLVVGGRAFPRACIFILNRKGLDNVIVELAEATDCDFTEELLIFKLENRWAGEAGAGDYQGPRVLGLWIHADRDDTQQVNADIIQQSWRQIRESLAAAAATAPPAVSPRQESYGSAMQAAGRRLSISDLFGASAANGP